MNIFSLVNYGFLLTGLFVFAIRSIIFFRSNSYSEEASAKAFNVMRMGIVMVSISISGMIMQRLAAGYLATLNVMLITGLVMFVILLIFTAQISRFLSVLAIRNDLNKIKENEVTIDEDVSKVILLEDPDK